ncbi:two-component system nitrate/nitrite sensor histidine kinase NarQ [Cricetibacter osteomyelitidis]|uniref:Sensor protein n=1 Tax=Cricetibacter osteomyelitidis TaxID=1521931 RepID=A0A4R2T190_9PAST|nr:nitrate/nitrite two-component system sensor histidine kinase NarQ [Cricetibacter osteomyelitidis]TCP94866.1 two-component system nitrate/nitrite sensor histidine kinase NarQ [Cricetibacter osteomyelitidis]
MNKKNSVSTRIAQYLFMIIAFVGVITTLSFVVMISNKSDAELINVSGSLRMQAYRLIYEAERSPENVVRDLKQYRFTLHSHALLDTQNSIWVTDTVADAYRDILDRWKVMENYILQQQFDRYQYEIHNYVNQLDKFVYELQRFSEQKLIIATTTITLSLLLIVAMVAYVIWYTRKQVVIPLQQLALASTQVQLHQFNHVTLDTQKQNELGSLARVFTQMSSELQKFYTALESRVSEKTLKLSQANRTLSMLYYCSQLLTVSELNRDKLQQVLQSVFANEHLRFLKIEIYGMEHWDIAIGNEPKNVQLEQEEVGIEGHSLAKLSWQSGLPCPDPRTMPNIAQLLGRALYFQQTQRQQQHLLLMEERSIIARELHDSLAQVLSFLQIQLTLLKHALNKSDETAKEKSMAIIKAFEQALRDGYIQLRELLATFRLTVQEANLQLALEQVIDSLKNQTDMTISLDCSLPSQTFTAQQQVHALQIVREAILNAIKHSKGTQIDVIARTNHDGENELIITDNGIGIPSLKEPDGHYGLNIMSERSAQLNAVLSISNRPEGGTEVKITLPNALELV